MVQSNEGGAKPRAPERIEAARLLLSPASLAVFGASEDRTKFGGRLYAALLDQGFPGRLYPINPRRTTLLGLPAFPDLASLPEIPDVAAVVLPAVQAQRAIAECAARGVRAAIVVASGFAESGQDGQSLQAALTEVARTTGPRLLGPNCLGLINAHEHIAPCATVALQREAVMPGAISMVSHSGALMTTLMTRGRDLGIGFRYLVSSGNEADLDACDFLEVFVEDPATRVIALFLEHIRRPSRFRDLARAAHAAGKPVVALKVGRSLAGSRTARSHTAAVAGDDAVIDGLFRSAGVLRVNSLEALLATCHILERTPPPTGPNVVVLSGSGGACGMLADLADAAGLQLATFSDDARIKLERLYEPEALSNPLDIGAMRTGVTLFHPDVFQACLEAIGHDPGVHALLIGLTTMGYMADNMRRLAAFARDWGRPVVVYGAVGGAGQEALEVVRAAGLPLIDDAERCVQALAAILGRRVAPHSAPPRDGQVLGAMSLAETTGLLDEWGLPRPAEGLATSEDEVEQLVERIGPPVALKIVSVDLPHKTEAHAVELNVMSPAHARATYRTLLANVGSHRPDARVSGVLVQAMVRGVEVIVGGKRDAQVGPVVLVGLGGVWVELLRDVSVRPAPVTRQEVLEMLDELKGSALLRGWRGAPPADVAALADLVSRFSQHLAITQGVAEIDLNPVIVLPEGQGVRVVDALVLREG